MPRSPFHQPLRPPVFFPLTNSDHASNLVSIVIFQGIRLDSAPTSTSPNQSTAAFTERNGIRLLATLTVHARNHLPFRTADSQSRHVESSSLKCNFKAAMRPEYRRTFSISQQSNEFRERPIKCSNYLIRSSQMRSHSRNFFVPDKIHMWIWLC